MKNHNFHTFGGNKEDTTQIINIFSCISGPDKKYIQTTAIDAEIAKYMENSFLACKVIFCHEIDQICKHFNADYNTVRELFLLDPRQSRSHTCVFSNKEYPFDGKCLPKDTKALYMSAKKKGYNANFILEVIESNERISKINNKNKLILDKICKI